MSSMLENHMVIGDYYSPRQASIAERADELLCDGLNCRDFGWIRPGYAEEILGDLAVAILKAQSPEEGRAEAYRVLEAAIEDWADEAAKEEE